MKWMLVASLLAFLPVNTDKDNSINETPPAAAPVCQVENDVFEPGEFFSLKVFYNLSAVWVGAGEIHFKTSQKELDGKPVYHMDIVGQTYKSYEWFYKVNDRYQSYVDPVSLKSLKFKRDIHENDFRINDEYDFNRETNMVRVKDFKDDIETTVSIDDCVHDIVSVIYFSRCIDFDKYQPGDRIPFSVFIDNETYEVFMKYEGKEQIKTKTGTYNTFVVKPQMVGNDYFEEDDFMTIYVSDDKNRLPVRIESPLTVGSMKADLKGFRGLRHPFEARLD